MQLLLHQPNRCTIINKYFLHVVFLCSQQQDGKCRKKLTGEGLCVCAKYIWREIEMGFCRETMVENILKKD